MERHGNSVLNGVCVDASEKEIILSAREFLPDSLVLVLEATVARSTKSGSRDVPVTPRQYIQHFTFSNVENGSLPSKWSP